jgi:hypothetical protein
MTESTPLVTEDDIINMVQSKATAYPSAKSYGSYPAEWIEDLEAIDLVTEVRDKYEAALAALRQDNARLAEEVERLQRGE